jgi:hypothetical protein
MPERLPLQLRAHELEWERDAVHRPPGQGSITNESCLQGATRHEAGQKAHRGAAVAAIQWIRWLGPLGGRGKRDRTLLRVDFERMSELFQATQGVATVFAQERIQDDTPRVGTRRKQEGSVCQ